MESHDEEFHHLSLLLLAAVAADVRSAEAVGAAEAAAVLEFGVVEHNHDQDHRVQHYEEVLW